MAVIGRVGRVTSIFTVSYPPFIFAQSPPSGSARPDLPPGASGCGWALMRSDPPISRHPRASQEETHILRPRSPARLKTGAVVVKTRPPS
eukprot:1403556-Prymnesium_polylepis.1